MESLCHCFHLQAQLKITSLVLPAGEGSGILPPLQSRIAKLEPPHGSAGALWKGCD